MEKLDLHKFRKLSISMLMCFPNVYQITLTKKNGSHYIDLWKNVPIVCSNFGVWNNRNYNGRDYYLVYSRRGSHDNCGVGRFCSIPIDFLGYNSVEDSMFSFTGYRYISRKSIRIANTEINTDNLNILRAIVNRISKYSSVKSITFQKFGKVSLNSDDRKIELSMRGSGLRTHIREEITKDC